MKWRRSKRLLSLLMALCMAVMFIPVVPMKAEAAGAPDWNCGAYSAPTNPLAQAGSYGQCVWYAWGRAYEVTGKIIRTVSSHSNACYWIENNTGYFDIGMDPKANSIAVWNNSNYGHVAYVESVNGNDVYISEANWTGKAPYPCYNLDIGIKYYNDNSNGEVQKKTIDEMKEYGGRTLLGYIYLDDPPPPDEWIGNDPIFYNNNQSAGEDFYAYIMAESGGNRYVECSTETFGEPYPSANVQLSAKPAYVGQLLDPKKIWHFMRNPGADYYIIRNEYFGWNLDVYKGWGESGQNLTVYFDNHDKDSQQWVLLDGGYNSSGGQFYNLATVLNRPQELYVMDVYEGTDAEGTNIQMFKSHGGVTQQFTVIPITYSKLKPSAPTNIRKVISSDNTVRFEWNEVPRTGTYDSRQYEYVIHGGISGTEQIIIQETTSANSTQEFTDFPLGNYTIEVKAINTMYREWYSDAATSAGTIGKKASVSKWPSASAIFYGQTLADSRLSDGVADVAGTFEWWDSTLKPKPGDSCQVLFTPDNAQNYWSCDSQINVTVNRTSPKVTPPIGGQILLGESLAASVLSGGTAINPYDNEIVSGSWAWCDSAQKPSSNGTYQALFIPDNTVCYQNSEPVDVYVTVEERKTPEEHMHVYNSDWKADAEKHWKECECGDKSEITSHSFVWESEEDSSSRHEVCSVCGYIGKTENNSSGDEDADKDNIEVESVSLDKNILTISIGASESLQVAVSPENATDKTFVWESSDTSVAEVRNDGIVTAKSAGTATITVKSANGKTASCQVTVEEEKAPEEHAHVYNSDWKADAEKHWKECECGDKSGITSHSFVWESEEDSSSGHEVCSVCGYIGKAEDNGTDNPDSTEISDNQDIKEKAEEWIEEVPIMWKPTTPEEKRRYECFGKEKVDYTLMPDNAYRIVIKNEMQGPLCFDAFDSAIDDYTIGRTYNIYPYPYPELVYSMEKEIQFTLKIPEVIFASNRKYKMICVTKKGEIFIYEDLDIFPETITIRTNRFYAYALLYKDIVEY